MFDAILAAIPFGIILAFTVGPVFFVLLETSATKGFKSALIFDLGVMLADIFFIAVAFFSTNRLLETIKDDPNFLIFGGVLRSEEHTSELQSRENLVCRLLLEKN